MNIDIHDAALELPPTGGMTISESWHWFWAKIFGKRVPTSADRAHIGNLLLAYRPQLRDQTFGKDWFTDAQRVHRIGDLYIFDYGDTPIETFIPSYRCSPKSLEDDNPKLLRENIKFWPKMKS